MAKRKLLLALFLLVLGVSCAPIRSEKPRATPRPTARPVVQRLQVEIIDTTFKRDTIGNLIVMGIIKNKGRSRVGQLEVSCIAYDASKHMVDTHTTFPELTSLDPGEETTFTCYLDEVSPIASYKCKVIQWR